MVLPFLHFPFVTLSPQTLDKARALFSYVVSTMRYDKTGEGWGRGDALFACTARKGNCTDFHALFIGMMRAVGIPARFEIGFPLPADKSEGQIAGYHCWAQFYLEGVGWIPVDASEAWKNPSKRDYFFGAHDQHRVLFTRGRDIRFNPAPLPPAPGGRASKDGLPHQTPLSPRGRRPRDLFPAHERDSSPAHSKPWWHRRLAGVHRVHRLEAFAPQKENGRGRNDNKTPL